MNANQKQYAFEWHVEGNYGFGHGWESVSAESSYTEARNRLLEYRENDPGSAYRIKRRRVRVGWRIGGPMPEDAPCVVEADCVHAIVALFPDTDAGRIDAREFIDRHSVGERSYRALDSNAGWIAIVRK